jgi:hypothetical protein
MFNDVINENEKVTSILLHYVISSLYRKIMVEYGRIVTDINYCFKTARKSSILIALKALHFEENKHLKNKYSTISKDLLEKYSLNDFSMLDYNMTWFLPTDEKEPYCLDLLCNLYAKEILRSANDNAAWNFDTLYTAIYECLEPKDEEYGLVENATQEEANRKRCYNCAFGDRCKEFGKIDNCSAYFPK